MSNNTTFTLRITNLAAWISPEIVVILLQSFHFKLYYSFTLSGSNVRLHFHCSYLVIVPKSIILLLLSIINLEYEVNSLREYFTCLVCCWHWTLNKLISDFDR